MVADAEFLPSDDYLYTIGSVDGVLCEY